MSSTQPSSAGAGAALLPRGAGAATGLADELLAQLALGGPDGVARHVADALPRVVALEVVGAQVLVGELVDLAVDPGAGVDAVGDARDRHLVVVEARPEAVEHLAADDAVELGDAVGALAQAQPHDGHVEDAGLAARVVLGAEREEAVDRHALDGLLAAEVQPHQLGVEAVDAGGHGRVRREDGGGADGLERLVEGQPARSWSSSLDPLDAEEAGVALVGVVDVRLGGTGQARPEAQGPDAADAEQHLLLEALLAAAAVEAVGDVAGGVVVLGTSESRSSSGTRPTWAREHVGVQLAATRQGEGDDARACRPPRAAATAAGRRGRAPGRSPAASRRG